MSNFNQEDLISELDNKAPNLLQAHSVLSKLQALAKDDPNNGTLLKELGHCSLILNDLKSAHEYYQQSLTILKTEDPELWYGIGLLYYESNNFLYAEPSFLKVISLNDMFPKRHSIYLKLGRIFKHYSLYQEAINYLNLCLDSEEKPKALIQLGFCYSKIGDKKNAMNSFKDSYELFKSPYSALCLAWCIGEDDLNAALEQINQALSTCLKDTVEELDLIYAKAQILNKKKEFNEAGQLYHELLNKSSADYCIWNSFGILCAEMGQHSHAFRNFIKASELSPNSPEVWNNIGSLYWMTGQINESRQAYEKAKKNSSNPETIKEGSKEFIYAEWNISELPFIKRPAVIRMKIEPKKVESPQASVGFVGANPMPPNFMNNYAAMIGYMNYARHLSAIKEKSNEDKKAAEILADFIEDVPVKRPRDEE